jgi:glycosyltransferase involved in cell wall biosynthesis
MPKAKKTVLYLATFDPTVAATGTATRARFFLRSFSEHYNVHLVHMRGRHEDGKDESLIRELASTTTVGFSKAAYFLFSRELCRAAGDVLRHATVDFIFADFEKAGWYAYLLSKKFRLPYVYSSHNVEFLRYLDIAGQNYVRYPLVPYMYFLEKIACRNALFTVAISELDAQTFRRWVDPSKVLVMPCAFDETVINPDYEELPSEEPVVLMVGNYRNAGNRDGAYAVYESIIPAVVSRHPNVRFRCVGRDFPRDIRHPNIEVAGFVDDLMAEYAKATVVIAPISMGGGIKIKVVEALASGQMLITTEKGMEGINSEGLENLRVAPVDQFSRHIIDAIETRPRKAWSNWEQIKCGYGVHRQLYDLMGRMDALVAP